MTKLLLSLAVLGTLAGTAAADTQAERLAKLHKAAKCDDKTSPWRPWCIAADYDKGTAADLPTGKILVGMTIRLQDGKDTADALSNAVTYAAFAVGKDGKVKLTDVKPTSKDEEQTTLEAVAATTLVFKDKAKTAKIPKGLGDYLRTLQGTYATKKVGSEWTWTGASPARMRKVGAFYVVLETPTKDDGMFATILTDAWE